MAETGLYSTLRAPADIVEVVARRRPSLMLLADAAR
jgi:hypothetical protein